MFGRLASENLGCVIAQIRFSIANETRSGMEERLPAKPSEIDGTLRKSAFGRTNLFLETSSAIFREIRCSASSSTRQAVTGIFHTHMGNNSKDRPDCVCWHCCHSFEGQGIRLPRIFDPSENLYHVYGWYCSANCAKAYILEHSTFDRGYQMNIFVRMLRDIYGIQGSVNEAPPRLSLKMFGGPFDIDAFRKQTTVCSLVTPPFVSYCMLIEERQPNCVVGENTSRPQRGTVRGLRRPTHPNERSLSHDGLCAPENDGAYSKFLAEHLAIDAAESTAPAPAKRPKRVRTAPESNRTGLGKFASIQKE